MDTNNPLPTPLTRSAWAWAAAAAATEFAAHTPTDAAMANAQDALTIAMGKALDAGLLSEADAEALRDPETASAECRRMALLTQSWA